MAVWVCSAAPFLSLLLPASSGDRGASAVRGEDQRFDADRAQTGAGGHHHVSEGSGESLTGCQLPDQVASRYRSEHAG